MLDLQSIFIYLGLAVVGFCFAKFAELTNKKIFVWLIVVALSLVSGLRAVTVGIDTKTYFSAFSVISEGMRQSVFGLEQTFVYICAILLKIWNNNNFLLTVFALISNGCVMFRIWKDRGRISFAFAFLTYYVLFFPFSLNGIRQFVAAAIIFYATYFIKDGKYIRFAVLTAIAALFHVSSVIGLGYLFFEIVFAKYFDKKRKFFIYLFVVVSSIVGIGAFLELFNKYSSYFERQADSVGFMMIVKFMMLVLSFMFVMIPLERNERYFTFYHRMCYFVGLLLNSMSYIFQYAGRIGLYFYVFEVIHIGYVMKAKNTTIWTVLFKFLYAAILLYYLYNNLASGSQGELPYRFFWQS